MKTVLPATPADAYGLMLSAIRDDDPVLYLAPAAVLPVRGELPDEPEPVPLGRGRIHREGTDVTVVAVGHLVHDALAVAEELADEISVEVFDPRTLYPFDWELLAASLGRTAGSSCSTTRTARCGFAAEVVATAAEEMPPRRPAPPRDAGRRADRVRGRARAGRAALARPARRRDPRRRGGGVA